MDFPGLHRFEPTPPLLHAIFTLREAIPAGCQSIRVELDERGAALVTAFLANGDASDCEVTLGSDAMAAAGLLLTYVTCQVIILINTYESRGEEADEVAQGGLIESLAMLGLQFGLLDETLADTITISRR